jgi:hypothetical protein
VESALKEPWICDVDVTIKTVYGHQEGAQIGHNPLRNTAEQLTAAQCWQRIWERILTPFRALEAACRACLVKNRGSAAESHQIYPASSRKLAPERCSEMRQPKKLSGSTAVFRVKAGPT